MKIKAPVAGQSMAISSAQLSRDAVTIVGTRVLPRARQGSSDARAGPESSVKSPRDIARTICGGRTTERKAPSRTDQEASEPAFSDAKD
jgi:hypothetical protein